MKYYFIRHISLESIFGIFYYPESRFVFQQNDISSSWYEMEIENCKLYTLKDSIYVWNGTWSHSLDFFKTYMSFLKVMMQWCVIFKNDVSATSLLILNVLCHLFSKLCTPKNRGISHDFWKIWTILLIFWAYRLHFASEYDLVVFVISFAQIRVF